MGEAARATPRLRTVTRWVVGSCQRYGRAAREQYAEREAGRAVELTGGDAERRAAVWEVEQGGQDRPLMSVTSHDAGKNAIVSVYVDRIERVKERSALSLSRANREAEVIPISLVSHVKAEKAGIRTNVTVTVAGESIVFRVSHAEAKALRDAIVRQASEMSRSAVYRDPPASSRPPATSAPPEANDPFEQIRKLGELRDQGLLSDLEFQTKKAQILGL
jgi:hypothetical protein